MKIDLVSAVEFLHQLTGKLSDFTNLELAALVVGIGTIISVCRNSSWYKKLVEIIRNRSI